MSTHRLILRRRRAFRLPAFSILAGLLLVLQVWLPASAFAATQQNTSPPPQDVSRAGVSVVRLLVSYSVGKTTDPAPSRSTALCTGLGVLLSSQQTPDTKKYVNWVLTDGSLVASDGQANCFDGNPAATLSRIDIYMSSAYNSVSFTSFSVTSPKVTCKPTPAKCLQGPALFSFPSDLPQPFIDLSLPAATTSAASTVAPQALQLINSTSNAETLNSSNQDAAHASDYIKQAQTFLLPKTNVPTGATSDGRSSLESGTPLVDTTGSLNGLFLAGAPKMKIDDIQAFVKVGMPKILGVSNPVHDNWKAGMDAFYDPHSTMNAQAAFTRAFNANPQFKAAQQFASLSAGAIEIQARKAKPAPANQNSSLLNGGLQVAGFTLPYWLLALALLLLFLFIIVLLLFVWRTLVRQRRKRILAAELADAERRSTIEAQRIAAMEAKQHGSDVPLGNGSPSSGQAQPTTPLQYSPTHQQSMLGQDPQSSAAGGLHCPRCGEEVVPDANFCANCRLQLSTTESGLHLRVAPPRSFVPGMVPPAPPVPPAPIPPSLPPLKSVADQPTLVSSVPVADQPTIDMTNDAHGDLEQTVPYSVHHLNGQRLGFLVGTRSDPGIKRKYKPNEDSLFAAQGVISLSPLPQVFGLFVVADGMGGHANGEDASRLAIQTIADYMLPLLTKSAPLQSEQYTQMLVEGIQHANLAVHQSNMQHHADMGTTVTATLLVDTVAHVANVGDSRTYLYRSQEGLKKVTNDHSVVASLVEAGIIKPDDIYTHPKRNQIYRSLGEKAAVEVDSFTVQLQAGDKLLLCSDGLWDMVRDPKIEAVIKNADPNPSVTGEALIQSALEGGGEDNVSVIVIHITDGMKATGLPRFQLLTKPDSVQIPQI